MTLVYITVIALLLFFWLYKGYKNTHSVAIKTIEMNENLTNKETPLRILHISDMHIENISITPERLFHELKDEPIDIIALTGDFLDRKRSIPRLKPYIDTFNKLEPKYGTFAVFGNHDYVLRKENFSRLEALLKENNVQVLQNENTVLDIDGKKVNIIGIDDFSTKHSDIEKSYEGLIDGYNLVLTHDPNIVLHMSNYNFDYLLSGHFHGGQIYWPKPYHLVKMGKLVRMNMVKGLHYHEGKAFYISEGLGQTGVNIRIGSRPEITFHELAISHKAKTENKPIVEATIAG